MVLFDWGTYNGGSKLYVAELLGMKLTEIPPYDFSRRNRPIEYFKQYKEKATKAFTTITAHAPYYSLIPRDLRQLDKIKKIMLDVAIKAKTAGAEILNMHIGGKTGDPDKDVEIVTSVLKYLLQNTKDIKFSLETSYSGYLFGSIEEIRAVIEALNSDRVLISLQLENDWMREFEVYRTGQFHKAAQYATEDFWKKILKQGLELGNGYLSLRFAQITGVRLRGIVVKKRVPLGMGYPPLEPLANAIAEFMVKEVYEKGLETKMHIIYTGIPQTKYVDTLKLYSSIMEKVVNYLR
ncbi:NEQ368 [Nanoarchaeum equitans Kin4-M]|uniref:NEQ368 n=1 Tax=Nanoarchaeum equitans (strain Kin4-M) TaxID=228908 RepID=Q74MC5_NANEQ|nr:NEQ368 [Nanoarchaeum equitans Kin4-M]